MEYGAWCIQRQNVALREFVDLSQERVWNERVGERFGGTFSVPCNNTVVCSGTLN